MTFFPPLPWPAVITLILALLVPGIWLAYRGSHSVSGKTRMALVSLRVAALCLLAFMLLNPGKWEQPEAQGMKRWVTLLDRSGSMATPDVEGKSRWEHALALARSLEDSGDDKVRTLTFSEALEDKPDEQSQPNGQQSGLIHAGVALVSQASMSDGLAGIVIISDGRQTQENNPSELIVRAKAAGVPVHVVPIGTAWGGKDLMVRSARRQWTAFPGKPVMMNAMVENRGLGPIQPRVEVRTSEGRVITSREVSLESGDKQVVSLELPAADGGEYRVIVPAWDGEDELQNNEDRFRIQVMDSRTRVFLAEGAPYWDSKFLAQLLREQGFMDVRAIYRLNAERFFRVDTSFSGPASADEAVFPRTKEALAAYDLVVLGKGMEGFLDEETLEALRGYVRDQGGAVLLARGKPYAGSFPGLETLEPVEWGGPLEGDFRFEPAALGESAGLFGQALPSAQDPVWRSLPQLKDVEQIARLKPFTQVLATGSRSSSGREEKIPLLLARRYGRGVVAAVNADGLWKWDFFPEARKLGNMYEEFWTQLFQWTATYAEFLPGQELSLRLSDSSVRLGRPVQAHIGWRGGSIQPEPILKVWRDGSEPVLVPCSISESDSESGKTWTASIQLNEPGHYQIQVVDHATDDPAKVKPGPQTVLQVLPPVSEKETLAADPAFLQQLAEATGGQVIPSDKAAAVIRDLLAQPQDPVNLQGTARWEPLWPQGLVFTGLIGLLTAEWWWRRRKGLL